MGLQEKRAIKSFQENQFPDLKAKIIDILGFDVEIEVKWDTLANNLKVHESDIAISSVYFEPVIQTFEEICSDDMGKEALQDVLKKIVFQDENGIYSASRWMEFKDGALTLDHEPSINIGAVDERKKYLQKTIENSL